MVVILPDKPNGLSALEKSLSVEKINSWMKKMQRQEINLSLPKFKLETKYDLVPTMKSLGVKDAFTVGDADFTALSIAPGAEKLRITGVFHKAFVKVDEEGTEAAAATGIVFKTESVRIVPSFKANHPFLFLIRDKKTNTILFLGRVMNPSK